ncbi:AzlD domain-containing protein [Rhodobacteraceae bacterium W635]|uniref:AzlD domain-containing protein n=1 Tax=Nioella halotolerans TaxID=2303578 RepID=UPI000E3D384A|nr:AzlD domain-containing protein [Rhodobacteraceae bacterium W635]
MTGWDTATIWMVIVLLGIGTLAIRWSFLGLLGNRELPDWALRHLRYTAVAILPALITPRVLWPEATGGEIDPARIAAALLALAVGYVSRNALATIAAGLGALLLLQAAGL